MLSFVIQTFGCQMNVHDSQRMRAVLIASGYQEVSSVDAADLIVVNTCSVRDKAERKLFAELGKMRRLKQRRPNPPVLAVTGCVASQRGESIVKRMPFVDIVLGPDNLCELPSLAVSAAGGAPPVVRTAFDTATPTFLSVGTPWLLVGPSAYVTVSKGCDEHCSFCIVPQTRGPGRDRPAGDIVAEITRLVQAGAREVALLGQTVNSYRTPEIEECHRHEPGLGFAQLLREIAARVPDLARLRYTSPHPRFFGRALADAHRDLDVLCHHVHMPVQSGSDTVLRRMVRGHKRTDYLEAVRALRQARPDLTVSTDIIVGFPGETEDDFEQTLTLMREVRFAGVYAFKYSPRPGTPGSRLGDDVADTVKSERLTRVFELSDALLAEHLRQWIGTEQTVLVEEPSPRGDGRLCGRTIRNEIVHIENSEGLDLRSGLVCVEITRAFRHSLLGKLAHLSGESVRQLPQCHATRLKVLSSAVTPAERSTDELR